MSRFDYIRYDEQAKQSQEILKDMFESLENQIGSLDDGRAKSLALTKLEESYMWVGKSIRDSQIARGGSSENRPERGN